MAYVQASCSPPLSLGNHYTDTISAVHHRPIRPLPKRRIKIGNTTPGPEAFPFASAGPEKLFTLPYYAAPAPSLRPTSQNSSLEAEPGDSSNSESPERSNAHLNLPVRAKPGDNGSPRMIMGVHNRNLSAASQQAGVGDHRDTVRQNVQNDPQSLGSSIDSVDGYDSFENTNNKKKRKIPTSGVHQPSPSTDITSTGLPSARELGAPPTDIDGGVGHYYGSGSSAVPSKIGNGLSGSGRGRIGRGNARRRSNRSPLGVTTNGGNLTLPNYTAPAELTAQENLNPPDPGLEVPASRDQLRKDVPHLSTKQASIPTPTRSKAKDTPSGKTQFTFTCASDSAKSISWPDYGYPSLPGAFPESMPNGVDEVYDQASTSHGPNTTGYRPAGKQANSTRAAAGAQAGQPRRGRRSLAKQYATAAKERKVRQAYNNFHHPPKYEDVWICEYCEYEAIFGSPPEALIRQYEIKDRRERRRQAEKQRLLEKAKMRNKRGKKGNKNSKNMQAATQTQIATQAQHREQQQQQQMADQARREQVPGQYPQDQAEATADEYLSNDYIDDQATTPTAPVKGTTEALANQRNPRQGQSTKMGPTKGPTEPG